MIRRCLTIFILLALPFVAGCWDVAEISQRGIANAVFFDKGNSEFFKMGVVLGVPGTEIPPIVGTTQQFEKRHFVVTGEGESFVDAWTTIHANTVRNIFFGQTRAIILSEEIAGENIKDIVDFIGRIPLIPPNTQVLVAKDDPYQLMDMPNKGNYTPGNYIDFYFKSPTIRSLAIPVDLWKVNSIMDQKTGDPFIPLIEASQNNYLIAGAALFSQNRMVGELDKDETQTLSLIRGTDVGYLTVPNGTNKHAAFSNVRSKTKITPDKLTDDSINFKVEVDIVAALVESFPHQEINWEDKKEIERSAERMVKKDMQELILKLQRLNTDPVGFRGKLRINFPHEWERIDWNLVYPSADISITTSFTVKETGLYR